MQLDSQALSGVKVLELGSLIAGPFAGRLMADFGAEVIKIEPPGKGDPLRNWRILHEGTSLWWYVQSRNKKSVTLDLKSEDGQEIIRELAKEIDVIIENFKPGTLEKWNIGYEDLKAVNPKLVIVRVSGYGQTGPYRDKPGFGSVGEAMGGIRYLTGYPDRPPTRVGVSLGDSVTALYAVIGTMMALYHRDVHQAEGQCIDVALYESIFSLMESMVPEYDHAQFIRERTGSTLPGITPSNIYKCKDGKYVVIGANGDSIFKRLAHAMGREEWAEDSRFQSNEGRSQFADYLDSEIEKWTSHFDIKDVLERLDAARIPAGPIYNVEDMLQDPHFEERHMIEQVEVDGIGQLKVPGIVPKLMGTPGKIQWAGPKLGEHTEHVLKEMLGKTEEDWQALKNKGTV